MPESSLLKLPTELLIQILSEVDLQTILRCKAVRSFVSYSMMVLMHDCGSCANISITS